MKETAAPSNPFEDPEMNRRLKTCCREALAVYLALGKDDQNKIPHSLVAALYHFASICPNKTLKPNGNIDRLDRLSKAANGIVELFIYFSGEGNKGFARQWLCDNINAKDREVIRKILLMKKKLEQG